MIRLLLILLLLGCFSRPEAGETPSVCKDGYLVEVRDIDLVITHRYEIEAEALVGFNEGFVILQIDNRRYYYGACNTQVSETTICER